MPALLLALGQTGCQNHGVIRKGDPLLGDRTPDGKGPVPEPAQSTKTRSVPAIPSSNGSPSPAALAAAEPLAGGRPPLRIEDPRAQVADTQPSNDWRAVGGPAHTGPTVIALDQGTGVQTASGTVLQRPEPLDSPPPVNTQPGVAAPAQSTALTYEQLQEQLKARNVLWQRQEPTAGGVRFLCAVPNPQSPDIQRFYEATAPDLLTAVRAVLNQIDQQR